MFNFHSSNKKFINVGIIFSAIIVIIITGYFILIRQDASYKLSNPQIEKESIIEYKVTGGIAGIRKEFIISKNGCYNLNLSSGLIRGSLADDNSECR